MICSHRRGDLVCDREAEGGHTYTPDAASHVDDRHSEGGHG